MEEEKKEVKGKAAMKEEEEVVEEEEDLEDDDLVRHATVDAPTLAWRESWKPGLTRRRPAHVLQGGRRRLGRGGRGGG